MWLSIIIPVYNCEAYLRRCLDSVLHQGLDTTEYEVIIVDDGSTDGSADVARKYCNDHSHFRLVSQKNSGVGAARNRGIDLAKGDYIEFIDADDWLLDSGLRQLKDYADTHEPMDMYTFISYTVDNSYDPEQWGHIRDHRISQICTFGEWVRQNGFGWSVWSRLISRDLLMRSGVRFSSHKVGEDVLFLTRLMQEADAKVMATNLNIYRYYVHQQSAVNRCDTDHNAQVCLGYIDLYRQLQHLKDVGSYPASVYTSSLNGCQIKTFLRMISGAVSVNALRSLRAKAQEAGALPVSPADRRSDRLINTVTSHMWMLYPLSLFCRRVFLPYIKPHIKRN